jgi:CBS domain-containing protein
MATVQSILRRKGGQVVAIDAGSTVLAAAGLMNEKSIGGLVVTDGERVIGIFTERDILRRVVAPGRDPATMRVGDVMTSPVACCRPETSLDECRSVMTTQRIRHLPVIERERLCGIVTIGDLMAHEVGEHQATIEYLESYIFRGR